MGCVLFWQAKHLWEAYRKAHGTILIVHFSIRLITWDGWDIPQQQLQLEQEPLDM